jgi:hypothetical protein
MKDKTPAIEVKKEINKIHGKLGVVESKMQIKKGGN